MGKCKGVSQRQIRPAGDKRQLGPMPPVRWIKVSHVQQLNGGGKDKVNTWFLRISSKTVQGNLLHIDSELARTIPGLELKFHPSKA